MAQKVSAKRASDKEVEGKHANPREINKIMGRSSKILEETNADITHEKARKINKDFERLISRIEEAGDILGSDSHTSAKQQIEDKKKVKREMEKLKKELEN